MSSWSWSGTFVLCFFNLRAFFFTINCIIHVMQGRLAFVCQKRKSIYCTPVKFSLTAATRKIFTWVQKLVWRSFGISRYLARKNCQSFARTHEQVKLRSKTNCPSVRAA
jgi:hypothetical protein